jgi:hypothetical protein
LNNKSVELEFIKDLTWDEVFNIWKKNEGSRENWQEVAKKRGFNSWEEWRIEYAKVFRCQEAKWSFYKIKNPVRDVPTFFGGPFRTWIEKYYKEKESLTFSQLIKIPELHEHKTVNDMTKNFPVSTELTGMVVDNEIFIIEGMHRCCALALMNEQKIAYDEPIFISLAESPGGKLPPTGHYQKGA